MARFVSATPIDGSADEPMMLAPLHRVVNCVDKLIARWDGKMWDKLGGMKERDVSGLSMFLLSQYIDQFLNESLSDEESSKNESLECAELTFFQLRLVSEEIDRGTRKELAEIAQRFRIPMEETKAMSMLRFVDLQLRYATVLGKQQGDQLVIGLSEAPKTES